MISIFTSWIKLSGRKSNKVKAPIYFLITILLWVVPVNGFAWRWPVHTQMAVDAINYFPESTQSELVPIRLKVTAPDENIVISHTNIGECAWMINKLAKKSIKQIQDGVHWDLVYYTIGYATHYIQDLNCPHHGIGRYDQGLHERFEAKVFVGFWENADFDGFQHIKNYKTFAYNAARFSKRSLNTATSYEMTLEKEHTIESWLIHSGIIV